MNLSAAQNIAYADLHVINAERMLQLHAEAREAIDGRADTHAGRCTVGLLEDLAITTLPAALNSLERLLRRAVRF